jgi:hypothetical protein
VRALFHAADEELVDLDLVLEWLALARHHRRRSFWSMSQAVS